MKVLGLRMEIAASSEMVFWPFVTLLAASLLTSIVLLVYLAFWMDV